MDRNLKKMALVAVGLVFFASCKPKTASDAISGNAAQKVYVAPGEHDEFYSFTSGGFSGQVSVYGIPSGRLLKVLPVFSQDPETGYGYSEDSKTNVKYLTWFCALG